MHLSEAETLTLEQLSLNNRHRDIRTRAALPVQRSRSPRGLPHCVAPNTHCKRSVLGALDFRENALIYAATAHSVKGPDVVQFLDTLIQQGDGRPTVIVPDNASI